MIYISAVITHVLYTLWGPKFDDKMVPSSKDADDHKIPQKFLAKGMTSKLVVGFFLGLIPLLGIVAHTPVCPAPTLLTGTTIADVYPGLGDAFVDQIAAFDLVAKARAAKGNVDYHFYRNLQNPNEFRFIETWKSQQDVQEWVTGYPQKVFSDPTVTQLLVGGTLKIQGAYLVIPPAVKPLHHGGVHFTMGSTCDKIWNVMSNWSDCSWVIGCAEASVDPKDPTIRKLDFPGAHTVTEKLVDLNKYDKSLKYTMVKPEGYTGLITLQPNQSGCSATYKFHVDGVFLESGCCIY